MALDNDGSAGLDCLSLIDGLGAYDGGAYHVGAYGLQSDEKQAEREKVLDFILSHTDQFRIKLLSMPGASWAFENMLLRERPQSQLVAIERSVSTFHRSRGLIPGIRGSVNSDVHNLQDRHYKFGTATLMYSRVTIHEQHEKNHPRWGNCGHKGWRSNRFVLISADAYMTMLATDYGASMVQKNDFHSRFYCRNAVWLDFTSQLCAPTEEAIRHMPMCLNALNLLPKPVVITVRNGRDAYRGTKERIARIQEIQPGLQILKHWTYTGKNTSSMLTVCGVIV